MQASFAWLRSALFVATNLVGCVCTWGQPLGPPAIHRPLIDDLTYPDAAAVQAAWRPMGGSAAAAVVQVNGQRALRLPCNFRGTTERTGVVGPSGEARPGCVSRPAI